MGTSFPSPVLLAGAASVVATALAFLHTKHRSRLAAGADPEERGEPDGAKQKRTRRGQGEPKNYWSKGWGLSLLLLRVTNRKVDPMEVDPAGRKVDPMEVDAAESMSAYLDRMGPALQAMRENMLVSDAERAMREDLAEDMYWEKIAGRLRMFLWFVAGLVVITGIISGPEHVLSGVATIFSLCTRLTGYLFGIVVVVFFCAALVVWTSSFLKGRPPHLTSSSILPGTHQVSREHLRSAPFLSLFVADRLYIVYHQVF